jgi:hypothetical protein
VVLLLAWVAGLVVAGRGARFVLVGLFVGCALFAVATQRGSSWLPPTVLAVWLALVAGFGFSGLARLVLVTGWTAWAISWWLSARVRAGTSLQKTWVEFVAADRGPLPGSRLVNEGSAPRGGRRATIVLPRGTGTTALAIAAAPKVASAFEKPMTSVTIEADPSGIANRATLLMLPRPATDQITNWPGPDLDLATGLSTIGLYVDGEPEMYAWFRPGSGAVGELIAGTTDAGKSREVDLLLATSRHGAPGYFTDWVCDPQWGQSLPDWVDSVDWFAKGTAQGLVMLRALYRVMLARNKVLAKARQKGFTPSLEMPLIICTLEEAPTLLEIPEARQLAEKIAKMGRKCGIKLRIVVQVPLLDQIGNSQTLRSMVVSGQAFLFRTADRISGNVMFPSLAIDPYLIPRRMPDGTTSAGLHYTQGVSTRTALARAYFVADPERWATTGTTTHVDALSAAAAGPEYDTRHDHDDDDDDEMAAPPVQFTKASPADAAEGGRVVPIRLTCEDAILAMLGNRPMSSGEIAALAAERHNYSRRQVRESLRILRDDKRKIRLENDLYHLNTKGDTP